MREVVGRLPRGVRVVRRVVVGVTAVRALTGGLLVECAGGGVRAAGTGRGLGSGPIGLEAVVVRCVLSGVGAGVVAHVRIGTRVARRVNLVVLRRRRVVSRLGPRVRRVGGHVVAEVRGGGDPLALRVVLVVALGCPGRRTGRSAAGRPRCRRGRRGGGSPPARAGLALVDGVRRCGPARSRLGLAGLAGRTTLGARHRHLVLLGGRCCGPGAGHRGRGIRRPGHRGRSLGLVRALLIGNGRELGLLDVGVDVVGAAHRGLVVALGRLGRRAVLGRLGLEPGCLSGLVLRLDPGQLGTLGGLVGEDFLPRDRRGQGVGVGAQTGRLDALGVALGRAAPQHQHDEDDRHEDEQQQEDQSRRRHGGVLSSDGVPEGRSRGTTYPAVSTASGTGATPPEAAGAQRNLGGHGGGRHSCPRHPGSALTPTRPMSCEVRGPARSR